MLKPLPEQQVLGGDAHPDRQEQFVLEAGHEASVEIDPFDGRFQCDSCPEVGHERRVLRQPRVQRLVARTLRSPTVWLRAQRDRPVGSAHPRPSWAASPCGRRDLPVTNGSRDCAAASARRPSKIAELPNPCDVLDIGCLMNHRNARMELVDGIDNSRKII